MPDELRNQIVFWADSLRDISACGLTFCKNPHDLENYKRIQKIAIDMMALSTNQLPEKIKPIRETVITHPTPFSVSDAAIVNDNGNLLLTQRVDNRLWSLPGGFTHVGETPAEGAIREASEETGLHCEAVHLIGIYDSHRSGSFSQYHMFTSVFLCKLTNEKDLNLNRFNKNEVLEMNWFTENNLPILDPNHKLRINHVFQAIKGNLTTFFDR